MKKSEFLLGVCMLQCVQSGPNNLEMVWLKDVTTSFDTGRRTHDNLDLPDELTFHLTSKSNALNLNLRRNRGIDPNADVFVVRTMKDGQPQLEKTLSLEKENLAYYQDRDNRAFMTVTCVKRSNRQCDRVINGNIRIGDKDYDIQLAEDDVTSQNVFDVPDNRGTQYVLREQSNIQRYVPTEWISDATNVNVKNVEQELIDLRSHFPREQDKRNHNRRTIDKRNKQFYWVEVAVLTDSTIWDFFVSLTEAHAKEEYFLVLDIEIEASRRIREYFSHVINGVHLLYNGINDPDIEISVTLREIIIFQKEHDIAFNDSLVQLHNGTTNVEIDEYLDKIGSWDSKTFGPSASHDHAMLFTRHNLFKGSIANSRITGRSNIYGICVPGERISVIEMHDDFETVNTATHELGHNLGLYHDGEGSSKDCPAEDMFIMTPNALLFDKDKPYSRNPWLFSNCSVRTFKKELKNRDCLSNPGVFYNVEEWKHFTAKQPGEAYSYTVQCELINGPNSDFCGDVDEDICLYMRCSDPATGICLPTPFCAARGTTCGTSMSDNSLVFMRCKEGLCVAEQ